MWHSSSSDSLSGLKEKGSLKPKSNCRNLEGPFSLNVYLWSCWFVREEEGPGEVRDQASPAFEWKGGLCFEAYCVSNLTKHTPEWNIAGKRIWCTELSVFSGPRSPVRIARDWSVFKSHTQSIPQHFSFPWIDPHTDYTTTEQGSLGNPQRTTAIKPDVSVAKRDPGEAGFLPRHDRPCHGW